MAEAPRDHTDARHHTDAPVPERPDGEAQQPHQRATPLLEEELERLRREVREATDKYLRTLAEFDNAKKRLAREKTELSRYAAEAVVRELLPILDSLDQALTAVTPQADPQAVVAGVRLIHRQLQSLLAKEGVERIPGVGSPFDPHVHEAVAQVDAEDHPPDGTVVEEIQAGYTLQGKVLRPALVKVAKTAAHRTQQTAHQEGSRQQPAHSEQHTHADDLTENVT
jgi:molecular chaperone GrpE